MTAFRFHSRNLCTALVLWSVFNGVLDAIVKAVT